jgi:D-alanyl-D-alanine carboxypeptidase
MLRSLAWLALLLWAMSFPVRAQPDIFPGVAAAYLVKADRQVLWEKQADKRLPPASLTKIMTGLLVLEHYRPQQVVTVGRQAAAESGSRLGLRGSDRMSVENLLAATLIKSANDACRAGRPCGGSEARFVALMNRRASGGACAIRASSPAGTTIRRIPVPMILPCSPSARWRSRYSPRSFPSRRAKLPPLTGGGIFPWKRTMP